MYASPETQGTAGGGGYQAQPMQGGYDRAAAEQLLQAGLDHYDREDLQSAMDCYYQALETDPTFNLAYNNLGMVLIDIEQYEQALEALYNSISLTPDFGEAFSNLGFALRRLGRDLEACSAYAQFLQLEPDVEEAPRIQEWINQVCQANGLTEIPPFALPQQQPADPQAYDAAQPQQQEYADQAAYSQGQQPQGYDQGYQAAPDAAGYAPEGAYPQSEQPGMDPAAATGMPEPVAAAEPEQEAVAEDPPKIQKMAAWEATIGTPETAAVVDAMGEFVDPGSAEEASQAPVQASEEVVEFRDEEMMKAQAAAEPQAAVMDEVSLVEGIERGMDFFAEGELDAAQEIFHQILAVHSTVALERCWCGRIVMKKAWRRYGRRSNWSPMIRPLTTSWVFRFEPRAAMRRRHRPTTRF